MAKFGFLIIGAGRGGTSLLAALLHQHPDIHCAMEAFSFDYLVNGKRRFWQKDSTKNRVAGFLKECQLEAKNCAKSLFANKITTEQILHAQRLDTQPLLQTLEQLSEDIKIIFCIRDARTQVLSKMKRGGKTLEEACLLWNKAAEIQELMMINHPKKIHTLSYENLLNDTENIMRQLCEFLQVKFDPALLELNKNNNLPPIYQEFKKIEVQISTQPQEPDWLGNVAYHLKRLGYS